MKFPRKCSISQNADFVRIRKTGHAKAGRFVILSTLEDPALESLHAAFITSKRASRKACERNLLRRRFRTYLQKHAPEFVNQKRYLVTIARADATNASNAELEADWHRQARRLGLFGETHPPSMPRHT